MSDRAIVLVVNRERILVDLLVHALESDNLAMFGASSVLEATRLFEQHRPDLIIVDPTVAGGFELMDQVRGGLKPARIVAFVDSDEMREKVAGAGVELTVDKAAGMDGLVGAIRASLSHGVAVELDGDGTRILVADDEEGMRTVLVDYLGGGGYRVSAVSDGLEAVEFVANDPLLRLVLLDLSMPRMGGLEALRQIMMQPNHPDVIMMTAVTDREIAKQTLNMGAFDYVLKPFELSSMDASIVACLGYADYHKRPWWKRLVPRIA